MCRTAWSITKGLVFAMIIALNGCTSPCEYIRNGFKVGPNPCIPQGPTAPQWIDQADASLRQDDPSAMAWWTVFQDPVLNGLVAQASSQNLSLREAGFRILEARAELNIAQGNLFPQQQNVAGGYQRVAASQAAATAPGFDSQFFNQTYLGFNLSWELDFWGRFRRAVTAAEDTLDASCANYNQVMVTLVGDVAANYIQIRTLQQRIDCAEANAALQEKVLNVAERRMKAGRRSPLEYHQARSNVAQTRSQVPQLRLAMRQACDRLCVLLGAPPRALELEFGRGPFPTVRDTVAVGLPAQLLTRRPDVCRAQFLAAAQGEQIGIAQADLYPMFAIDGTLGWESQNLSQLFTPAALNSNVGPVFRWNILNYGRIHNNVRAQDAKFQALVAAYQETVLRANAEVEDGIAAFLRAQERAKLLDESVAGMSQAAELAAREYQTGTTDFNWLATIQQNLVVEQDLQAQAHGDIAQGLVEIYRALGGGWQTGAPPATIAQNGPPAAMPQPLPADRAVPLAPTQPQPSGPASSDAPPAPMPPTSPQPQPAESVPSNTPPAPMPPTSSQLQPAKSVSSNLPAAPMPPASPQRQPSDYASSGLPAAPMPPASPQPQAAESVSVNLPAAPMPPALPSARP